MVKKGFFEKQKDGTAVKIEFYEHYIEGYLIKVLMRFGVCIVADLFCGPGKNGNEKGSPLILLEKSLAIVNNKKLLAKFDAPEIIIIFNDNDRDNIKKLQLEIEKIKLPKNIKILPLQNKNFHDILEDIEKINRKIPKFFFLDPFTYSNVQTEEIKRILALSFSEVLLFLPTFFAYRFASSTKNPEKLRIFLNNFTDKGVYNYKDIFDFNESIRTKLRKELNLEYIRYGLIDIGRTKNSLFLLSKNIKAIMLFNNIFWKATYNGKSLQADVIKKYQRCLSLFSKEEIIPNEFEKNICEFQDRFVRLLKQKKEMTNIEIIKFAVCEGFKPKHANIILKQMKKDGGIDVIYLKNEKTRGFYVSEENCYSEFCIIRCLDI